MDETTRLKMLKKIAHYLYHCQECDGDLDYINFPDDHYCQECKIILKLAGLAKEGDQ